MNRRRFLRFATSGVLVAGGGLLAACGGWVATRTADELPSVSASEADMAAMPGMSSQGESEYQTKSRPATKSFDPDIEVDLRAHERDVQVLPGKPTRVWSYDGVLVSGPADALQSLSDSYLGPIIRVRQGQKVRVNFTNNLPSGQETVIHWHGLHLPEDMDGHPRFAIAPGVSYAYEFEVIDHARTAWFHPHPHGKTASQVYNGLAGVFIVTSDDEAKLGLPLAEFDVPLVIQDRTFDKNNRLAYFGQGIMAGQMEQLMGFLGEKVLINGRPDFVLSAKTSAYRLRILNGSNGRIYKLGWGDNTPVTIIGTDGGLLDKAKELPFVMLAPGERVEMWADFSGRAVGDEITMESFEFFGAEDPAEEMKQMGDMAGGGHGGRAGSESATGTSTVLGAPMTLFTVKVTEQVSDSPALPSVLTRMQRYSLDEAVNKDNPRMFELKQTGARWKINGREFEMDGVADDEIVKLNTTEVWEVVNATSPNEEMHKLGMAHPFHVHGAQFLVLERKLAMPELQPGYDTVREGYLNNGWKDTVLVMPGERVKLLMKFSKYPGTFVYHCHNLEHEDMSMMRNYKIVG